MKKENHTGIKKYHNTLFIICALSFLFGCSPKTTDEWMSNKMPTVTKWSKSFLESVDSLNIVLKEVEKSNDLDKLIEPSETANKRFFYSTYGDMLEMRGEISKISKEDDLKWRNYIQGQVNNKFKEIQESIKRIRVNPAFADTSLQNPLHYIEITTLKIDVRSINFKAM